MSYFLGTFLFIVYHSETLRPFYFRSSPHYLLVKIWEGEGSIRVYSENSNSYSYHPVWKDCDARFQL